MSTIGAGNASTRLPKLINDADDYSSSFPFAGYEHMSVGVDAKSDQTDNVFLLEKLLETDHSLPN
jgi:hypothetical protein